MQDVTLALRVSNAIAIALLFLAGYRFAQLTGRSPVVVGMAMVVLGAVLVSATIALGG
jgi:VIT1/CCC1 family predicted Fe2+/Mn2+ transporter